MLVTWKLKLNVNDHIQAHSNKQFGDRLHAFIFDMVSKTVPTLIFIS